ncbi:hypothetical protein POTOM_042410 [Populus tomentosa]|uniref:Proteasome alpha-type subunits domain-containing protein n=1 Tax=Populus tomentosa TaxID=118781 RepID=A0A8X8CA05_POPTO|nr:hypothetical protein POTOM_042410 [Populus tomentosa]
MGDSQYSFSLTTFSPTGKLVQIEHALTAVGSGQTSLGIKAANGVVIATEKKLPSILVDESSVSSENIESYTQYWSCLQVNVRNWSVEWVLTFEFKVGSKQSNIIDCTRLLNFLGLSYEWDMCILLMPLNKLMYIIRLMLDNLVKIIYLERTNSCHTTCEGNCCCHAIVYSIWVLRFSATHTEYRRFEGQISGKNIEIGIIGADKQFRHALS